MQKRSSPCLDGVFVRRIKYPDGHKFDVVVVYRGAVYYDMSTFPTVGAAWLFACSVELSGFSPTGWRSSVLRFESVRRLVAEGTVMTMVQGDKEAWLQS